MIQELFAGASLISSGERTSSITNNGGAFLPPHTSPCPSSTTTVTTTTTNNNNNNTTTNSENQNLRCPRCDSSNTKFCYYNNYNLTQPRHFCKTCRRYWTKGGALRNVPIGGGCRKNKTNIGVSSSAVKTTTTKLKSVASELGRPGFSPELPSSPILWGSPQNSHLLALLRANQTPNPNPNPNHMSMMGTTQSHMMTTEPLVSTGMLNNPRTLSYDSLGQVPSLGLCNSIWRNNQDHPQQQNGGFNLLGETQNSSGIQELYQKLRSSSTSSGNNYCSEGSPVFLGTVASNSSTLSNIILESNSVAGGELGYWNNPTLSWSDLPTTHGAYP